MPFHHFIDLLETQKPKNFPNHLEELYQNFLNALKNTQETESFEKNLLTIEGTVLDKHSLTLCLQNKPGNWTLFEEKESPDIKQDFARDYGLSFKENPIYRRYKSNTPKFTIETLEIISIPLYNKIIIHTGSIIAEHPDLIESDHLEKFFEKYFNTL